MAEGLGDCIMLSGALPAIRARFSDAKISLLIFSRFEEYFKGNSSIDRLIVYPDYLYAREGLFKFILFSRHINRQCKPDVVLDLLANKNIKPAVLSLFIKSRITIGFGHLLKNIFYDVYVRINWDKHFFEVIFDALETLDISRRAPEYWIPHIVPESDIAEIKHSTNKTIIISPGGKNNLLCLGKQDLWSFDEYPELVKSLVEAGYKIVLVGAEYDKDIVWDNINNDNVVNLIGKTSLNQIFNLVKNKADLVVCNNSGLLHVAVACGKPTVSYAGPLENIVRFGPYPNQGQHRVLQPSRDRRISCQDFLALIEERFN
ncbi:MAG: glycosyltransferase family 9 protein [Candidatus Omnitrophica bacterium]|nr:glycosyltransferase family 9 protein [Candidatus Omnitrophota bacterium]MBU1869593.1 glycosyltransferase family 9 protein [Candidatus Omnitrophota bacterium]